MLNIPKDISNVLKTFENKGFEAYIVGGCVRDLLLKKEPNDYDITTNAQPNDIKSLFSKTIDTGIKHGTVSVFTETGRIVEVTTFRSDGDYKDGRHPQNVSFVRDIKEDLARRDFTVNAIAYNEKSGIVDFFGGSDDLKSKRLKAVGDPDIRFSEDALRIMRYFRFRSTLLFEGDKKTEKSAISLCKNLSLVSAERIRVELIKTLLGENPDTLSPIIKKGGLSTFGIKTAKNLKKISLLKCNENLRLFAFLKACDCDIDEIKEKLKLSNDFVRYYKKTDAVMFLKSNSSTEKIKLALSLCDLDIFEDFCDYKTCVKGQNFEDIKKKARKIVKSAEPYKLSQLALSGDELKKKGITDKKIGETLQRLIEKVRKNPRLNNKKDLEKFIK